MFIKIVAGLLLLNGLTYLAFWSDKRSATKRQWRIPEAQLLLLCAMGGTPAALYARQRLRHKTQKQPFTTYLWLILILQIIGLCFAGYLGITRPLVA